MKLCATGTVPGLPSFTVGVDANALQRERTPVSLTGLALGAVTVALMVAALAVRSSFVVGLIVLAAVFVPLERIFALRPQRVLRRRWRSDLVHLVVNNLLTLVLLGIAVVSVGSGLHAAVPEALRRGIARQPQGVQVAAALLIAELGQYWGHRASHRFPWLWRFHKVHHSIAEMDWLAAGRLHPVDQAFTRSCALLPLFALGFSKGTFGGVLVFFSLQALFIHANVRLRFGPLRWLIGTPEFHHWHHSSDPAAYNTNFSAEFPWLDLVFGTLHLPARAMPAGYGVDEPIPDGYLRQLAWPFSKAGSV